MHCENKRARRASLAEDEAHVGELGDRCAFAAQSFGHHHPEQALLLDLGESFAREASGRIDQGRVLKSGIGGKPCAYAVARAARIQDMHARISGSLSFHGLSFRWGSVAAIMGQRCRVDQIS